LKLFRFRARVLAKRLRFFGSVFITNFLASALLSPLGFFLAVPCATACINPYCFAEVAGILCYDLTPILVIKGRMPYL
ncbi:hypothetical protein LCGC14_2410400, partial [marine sediment metagenome]